jgi:hypothetical protein
VVAWRVQFVQHGAHYSTGQVIACAANMSLVAIFVNGQPSRIRRLLLVGHGTRMDPDPPARRFTIASTDATRGGTLT